MRKIVLIVLLILVFNGISVAQNWFPLEIGNRWDFEYWAQCPGGSGWSDTIIVEVVADTNFNTNKTYFIFSTEIFGQKYICIDNDSLYIFNYNDSTDCLIFAFDRSINSFYYSCKYDSVYFTDTTNKSFFGVDDIQQNHGTFFSSNEFSKNFGLVHHFYLDGLCETYYDLKGCIISGITYGQLLSNNDDLVSPILRYTLSQNYPNPFNPSTKISWQSPVSCWQTLKVYDVLGKEVATLVNEEKPAGYYEVEFNPESSIKNPASGVYFYQLKAGDYVETKKMLLLR